MPEEGMAEPDINKKQRNDTLNHFEQVIKSVVDK